MRSSLFNKLSTLVLLCLGSVAVQAGPDIQHWETKNGGRVYFVPAPELPIVDVRLLFDAGSARDGDKFGIARLTNGLLVEGSDGQSATAMAEGFETVGAQIENHSHRDMAVLGMRSLSEESKLNPAVSLFALMAQKPDFTDVSFQRDQQNILQNIKRSTQNPQSVAAIAFYRALYGDHPYAHPTSGTTESVTALTPDDVRAFFKQHYVARNGLLVLVGDLSTTRAKEIAEQIFSGMPEGKKVPPVPTVAKLSEAQSENIQHPSSQSHINIGLPAIAKGDPKFFALAVGNHILGGGGFTSRLVKEIREDNGLAYSVSSRVTPMRAAGPFSIGLQTKNEQAEQAKALVNDVLKKFVMEGPSKSELTAAKRNITGGFALQLDSNKKILGTVSSLAFYDYPLDYLDTYVNNIQRVKRRDIRRAFQALIDTNKLVTVVVGGGESP